MPKHKKHRVRAHAACLCSKYEKVGHELGMMIAALQSIEDEVETLSLSAQTISQQVVFRLGILKQHCQEKKRAPEKFLHLTGDPKYLCVS